MVHSVTETIDYQKMYGVSKLQFNRIKKDIMAEIMPFIIDYANCAHWLNEGHAYFPQTKEVGDLVRKENIRRGSDKYKKDQLIKAKEKLRWMSSLGEETQKELEANDQRKTA